MKFTEEKLEQVFIELLGQQEIPHVHGSTIQRNPDEVLIEDDLKTFLLSKCENEQLTQNEAEQIIRQLKSYAASDLYESNKTIMKLLSDEFILKREDRNIYKFVNQFEIIGFEKRIPDGIIYINGLPLVVFEFKTAIRENCTIHDTYVQLTTPYRRDIPELFKYNTFCVISDGVNNKAGSFFAPYEFFLFLTTINKFTEDT